jgi:5-carboxymethyl-2-hydroxymuconate isomerase
MPHINVEYSEAVADAFDRPAFAKDTHQAVVDIAGGRAGGCKSRFTRLDETYIADGSAGYAMIHVRIGVLSGRATEVKRELTEAVLALLRKHTAPVPQVELQLSVELRDLDRETYARHEESRTGDAS